MNRYAHVTGWGMAVPDRVLTNQELSRLVDTNDDWIVSRTGIRERRIAQKGESTATLAARAALRALARTDLRPTDIQMIIVATASPEHIFPATACIVQDTLGATNAAAFDLSAACTGFIYGLSLASHSIRAGAIENAIVIGAETLSRLINWEDRSTCILFGDGAGAFVLQASHDPGGFLASVLHADGSGSNLLTIPAGGSRMPASLETVHKNLHTIQMNGREIFRFATRVMASSTREVLTRSGIELDDVELVIPHQANRRIIEAAARSLRLPMERFMVNIERYGNTSSASIPIAACEAIEQGRIRPGDHVVLVAFGAGLTYGALVLEWVSTERPIPPARRGIQRLFTFMGRVRSLLRRFWRHIEGLIWGTKSHKKR